MAKVILICGKIASGKSFYAKQLKDKEKAVVLNVDELTYDLFGNEQGDKYEERIDRAKKYLMKKTVELVNAECNIILDWGFWDAKTRSDITKYFEYNNINVEWHYIDIKDTVWNKNIEERNKKVKGLNISRLFDGLLNYKLADVLIKKSKRQNKNPENISFQDFALIL